MRLKKAWVIGITLLGMVQVGAQAEAAERGFYVGAGVGHGDAEGVHLSDIDMDASIVGGSTDDTYRAWKVFAGYALNPYLAVETAWIEDVWKSRIDGVSDGSGFYNAGLVTHKGNADGWTIEGRVSVPVTGALTAYARAGALWWDVDGTLTNATFGDILDQDDGVGFVWGAGVQYDLTDQLALWGEWQRFPEISELDSEIFWGGLRVGF